MHDRTTRVSNLEEIGRLVRSRRKAAGLTLDEAAAFLGVGRRFLIELEHGKRRANIVTLLRVLQALGLELVIETRTPGATATSAEQQPTTGEA